MVNEAGRFGTRTADVPHGGDSHAATAASPLADGTSFSPIRVTAQQQHAHSTAALPSYLSRLLLPRTQEQVISNQKSGHAGHQVRLPTQWNTRDKCSLMDLSRQGLRVSYSGNGKSDSDAATVRANYSMRPELGVFYYEVTVISKGRDGYIGIGFCGGSVSLQRLPGWESWSWGYHGDDGNSFGCSGTGKPFGPTFTTRDVIGCGINFLTRQAFFTKNGIYLGVAFNDLNLDGAGPLFPAVGLRTPGEVVEANFGHTPFRYDIDRYVEEQCEKLQHTVDAISLASYSGVEKSATTNGVRRDDAAMAMHDAILDYMIHCGYAESARALTNDVGIDGQQPAAIISSDQRGFVDADNRKKIQERVLCGDIPGAIQLTNQIYPQFLDGTSELGQATLFALKCRIFIEMMAAIDGRTDSDTDMAVEGETTPNSMDDTEFQRVEAAMQYGQQLQDEYRDDDRAGVQQALMDIFSLLAYREPLHSPVGDLLHKRHRVALATRLNDAIMEHSGAHAKSTLERAVRQLGAVAFALEDHGRGAAPFVHALADCAFDRVPGKK